MTCDTCDNVINGFTRNGMAFAKCEGVGSPVKGNYIFPYSSCAAYISKEDAEQ